MREVLVVTIDKKFAVTLYKPFMVSEGKDAGFHLPPMFPPENTEGIQDPNMYREHYVFKVATYIPDPIGSILRSLPWIEMKNLSANALFLGDNSSISILTSNFLGCQRNSIYFTHDKDDASLSKQGHNLQSGRITSFGLDGEIFAKMRPRGPIFIVPTLNTS